MKTKHFKILSLLLIVSLTFSSCSKEENDFESIKGTSVAELKNGKPVITVDKIDLLKRFEQLASIDNVNVKYEYLEIKELENDEYALFAFSKDYLIKSATLLELKGDELNVSTMNGGSVTCSTTGCSSTTGCLPIRATLTVHGGDDILVWVCTECSADCTRSATVNL